MKTIQLRIHERCLNCGPSAFQEYDIVGDLTHSLDGDKLLICVVCGRGIIEG